MLHGLDEKMVDLALAAHDIARHLNTDQLLAEATALGINIGVAERTAPVLLHGPIGARWLKNESDCEDVDLIESVRIHTTGKVGMGDIAKVVFLADKLDPDKSQKYPFMNSVREASGANLDRAILLFLNGQFAQLIETELVLHPDGVALRNHLIATI